MIEASEELQKCRGPAGAGVGGDEGTEGTVSGGAGGEHGGGVGCEIAGVQMPGDECGSKGAHGRGLGEIGEEQEELECKRRRVSDDSR